jgi:hypothetical protein
MGGSAIGICFNTVAVLFLLDVDDQAFQYGLSDVTRKEVEDNARPVCDLHGDTIWKLCEPPRPFHRPSNRL